MPTGSTSIYVVDSCYEMQIRCTYFRKNGKFILLGDINGRFG